MELLKRTWAEINLDALCENFNNIKKAAAGRSVMAVVKADAYGHGCMEIAPYLQELGCEWFAVSNIREAMHLREYGIKTDILILGHTSEQHIEKLCEYDITQTVFSAEYAEMLSRAAQKLCTQIKAHIKVDTGMGRIGFNCREGFNVKETANEIERCTNLCGINCTGIFTHFAVADSFDSEDVEFCNLQYSAFNTITKELANRGVNFENVHCCNSAALCLQEHTRGNLVRAGCILYGLLPSADITVGFEPKPVLSLKSVVSMVKTIKEGDYVSYGRTYKAVGPTRVATVTIGYADGYPRSLSNKGRVIVNGCYAPIIGRICMDQIIIDVSEIDEVREGDIVTLIGCDGDKEITADEVAKHASTINYEIVCGVSQRVPRLYVRGGKKTVFREYITV